jgi:hypothetical protein
MMGEKQKGGGKSVKREERQRERKISKEDERL